MTKKYKICISIGIMVFLLLTMLPVSTKGDEEIPWDITLQGEGNGLAFQSSVVMDIYLNTATKPEDVTVFINRQKIDLDWEYEQSAKITLKDEGSYEIHLVHKNGYEETRKIFVELSNPTIAKISTRSYSAGTWSKKNVLLEAYGAKAISGIRGYEYKIGQGKWRKMQDDQLEIATDFDDIVYIRAVSNAGREGMINQIIVRVWKKKPVLPSIYCDQVEHNGWYQKNPTFSYELKQKQGPQVHLYAKLKDFTRKEIQTGIDQIPSVKRDGRYELEIFTKDEALNTSEKSYHTNFMVDTKEPEIFFDYENKTSKILKHQKVQITVKDENLKKENIILETTGRQKNPWKQEGQSYKTEVDFQREGNQKLSIHAKDQAGNQSLLKAPSFQIDTKKPKIKIDGIENGKTYKKPVKMRIDVQDENLNNDKTRIYLNGEKMSSSQITKDGYYTLKVEAEDLVGNKSTAENNFTINQKGIQIYFLQQGLRGKNISKRNLRPGFQIESLEPVQVMSFSVNGKKMAYQWKESKVYLRDALSQNGNCNIRISVKDSAGNEKTSDEIRFFYDTKKPEIEIKGLNDRAECEYGDKIYISIRNKKDQWERVLLDGKEQKILKNSVIFEKLKPGKHTLHLEASDLAGNVTKKKVKFEVTKIIPKPVKEIVTKKDDPILKHDKKKQNFDKIWVSVILGIGTALVIAGIALKHRKYEHS